MGYGSFAPGNAEGGLSTLEEKSAGAYVKSGSRPINGVIRPTQIPDDPGLYLLDVVPDTPPKFGFPNISDNAEIVELMSCGAHRSEEHTSELQSLMRISYAVFCLKKKHKNK